MHTSCRSTAVDAAADSNKELGRLDALLSSERDRCRILDAQREQLEGMRMELLARLEAGESAGQKSAATAADAARARSHADAQVKTLQGRVKLLEAQLDELRQKEAALNEKIQAVEGERVSAVGAAAKETSALSAALRAARARCFSPSSEHVIRPWCIGPRTHRRAAHDVVYVMNDVSGVALTRSCQPQTTCYLSNTLASLSPLLYLYALCSTLKVESRGHGQST
jgi:hypothetical protein